MELLNTSENAPCSIQIAKVRREKTARRDAAGTQRFLAFERGADASLRRFGRLAGGQQGSSGSQ